MDNEMIQISPKAFGMMIIACNLVGAALKATPGFPNRLIPWVLIAAGTYVAMHYDGFQLEVGLVGASTAFTAIGLKETVRTLARGSTKHSASKPPTQQ